MGKQSTSLETMERLSTWIFSKLFWTGRMNKLQFRKHNLLFVIITLVLIVSISLAIISTFWPKYEERFFEFGLLGADKRAETYYSNNNSTLNLGSPVNWYVYIHNHVGSLQDVIVRVKLLNSTMELPNNEENKPSPFVSFIDFPLSLSDDESKFVAFSWSVTQAVTQNDSIILKSLMVNNQTFAVNVSALPDSFFRMVFELWVYDKSSQEYLFGWESGEDFSSASLHLVFRVDISED